MLKRTRIRVAAVSMVGALGIGLGIGQVGPRAFAQQGCDGECPPGCGVFEQSQTNPAIAPSNFDPQGGNGGGGGTSGCSQGYSQGQGQGGSAGGTGSGPTIGAGGGETPPPSPGATTFGPTPVATPAAAGSGTMVFGRGSSINVSQHSHANVRAHNSNRAGNANGGRGGNASNRF